MSGTTGTRKNATLMGHDAGDIGSISNSGGAGNDTFSVNLLTGQWTWDGGGGNDLLIADYTGETGGITAYLDGPTNYRIADNNGTFINHAYNIERVSITGGSGNDYLSGTSGNDVLRGGAGNDTIGNTAGADTIDGGAGMDAILLDLSAGATSIAYDAVAAATAAGTSLSGGTTIKNVELIYGIATGSGNDTFSVNLSNGQWTWEAGGGNDRLIADYSGETGGIVSFATGSPIEYYTADNNGTFINHAYNIERVSITGGSGNDYLSGMSGNDVLKGGAGDDTIGSTAGTDTLDGGAGMDSIVLDLSAATANVAYDAVAAASAAGTSLFDGTTVKNIEHIYGIATGSGNDTVSVDLANGQWTWQAQGGSDLLTADYSGETGGIFASLNGSPNEYRIADFNGTFINYADNIERVSITGGSGNDVLYGTSGNDTLRGGAGDDNFGNTAGVDAFDGGTGIDSILLDLQTATANIVYDAVAAATATGTSLFDGTTIKNTEHIFGIATGSGDDTVSVNLATGQWTWNAQGGNDVLIADFNGEAGGIFASLNGSPAEYRISDFNGTFIDYAETIEAVRITGGSGNDFLSGTAGNDILSGGAGDDNFSNSAGADTFDGGAGTDSILLDLSAATANVVYDAVAAATATGTSLFDGTTLKNIEHIAMATGSGDDTFIANLANGQWLWQAQGGNDRLIADYSGETSGIYAYLDGSPADYRIADNNGTFVSHAETIEVVSITGGSGNDYLSGTSGDDVLSGNAGNDTLTGGFGNDTQKGGSGNDILDGFGADRMSGGAGDDTYFLDDAGDKVFEFTTAGVDDGGHDLVVASISYALGAFVEDLNVTGVSNGTGNSLGNVITGDANTNVLRGLAGNDVLDEGYGGNDKLYGGAGNDTYVLHTKARVYEDTVAGVDDGGVDTVISSGSYTLGAFVENLTLTDSAVSAFGNGLGNVLRGDGLSNKLDGLGGADTMYGGGGNDYYYVDNAGDVVSEQTVVGVDDGGFDRVTATVDFTLGAFIEQLVLGGTGAINGTGNDLANTITGNAGNNRLSGKVGSDDLTGGAGADDFVFAHFGSANGNDHLKDFVSGVDHLAFTAADYGWSAGHVLTATELSLTGVAVGTDKQFVYDAATHQLYWDSNGSAAGGVVALATFDNGAAPTTGDFVFT